MASHAVRHHYPVAIVGAGPSGLVLSSLLSRWGVKHVLLERREALTRHPQAHYISLRTMEILRHALPDVEASVLRACAPARDWRDFVVCSAVTERELGRVDNFTSARRYEGLSPARVAHLPQHRFLDMLLADTRNASAAAAVAAASQADGGGADILFGAEVHRLHLPTSSAGDAGGASGGRSGSSGGCGGSSDGVIRLEISGPSGFSRINCRSPRGDGDNSSAGHGRTATSSREITCDRLVGADGSSSTVRAALGVRLLGGRGGSPLGHLINVHFRVGGGGGGGRNGLAARLPGPRPAMLYWVYNEEVVCVFVAHNVGKGDWSCQIPFFPALQPAETFTFERARQLVLAGLGAGARGLPLEVLSVMPWRMSAAVAERYCGGGGGGNGGSSSGNGGCSGDGGDYRVLLAGDAAHQFPPAGGFGMNTGIQDVVNLAWRLALVHRGAAPASLLEGYEHERRPVAVRNAALSVHNYRRSLRMAEALGLDPRGPDTLRQFLSGSQDAADVASATAASATVTVPVPSTAPPSPALQAAGTAALAFGRAPLKSIRRTGNAYGDHRVETLRSVLRAGAGLPLLFPLHDIGYVYPVSSGADDACRNVDREDSGVRKGGSCSSREGGGGGGSGAARDDASDRVASVAALRVGGRMPHFLLAAPADMQADGAGRLDRSDRKNDRFRSGIALDAVGGRSSVVISTVDLPSQLSCISRNVTAVLIVAAGDPGSSSSGGVGSVGIALADAADAVAKTAGWAPALQLALLQLLPEAVADAAGPLSAGTTAASHPPDVALVGPHLEAFLAPEQSENPSSRPGHHGAPVVRLAAIDVGAAATAALRTAGAAAALIRPDGHIAWLAAAQVVAPAGAAGAHAPGPSGAVAAMDFSVWKDRLGRAIAAMLTRPPHADREWNT